MRSFGTFIALSMVVVNVWAACTVPQTFTVTCDDTNCNNGFSINGNNKPTIVMSITTPGCPYTFNFNQGTGSGGSNDFRLYYRRNGGSTEITNFAPSNRHSGSYVYTPVASDFNRGSGTYYYAPTGGSGDTDLRAKITTDGGPIDGAWGPFTGCTAVCNGGVATRQCNAPAPANGGAPCPGATASDLVCNTHSCDCKIDLQFVLDGSHSIAGDAWDQLKIFAQALTTAVNTGNGTIVGVEQFSTNYQFEIDNPKLIGDVNVVLQVLQNLVQLDSNTAIGNALLAGQGALIEGGRWGLTPPIPKVILLITDGENNAGVSPLAVHDRIKRNGTEIFVIGVGNDFNQTVLQIIASQPTSVHFFLVSGYDVLNQIVNQVAYDLCYSRGGAPAPSLYLLFLLLLPITAGVFFCFFVYRRRKPKPKPVPPPVVVPEPEPVPVKVAAPTPVADKPKDWTVPGTRYIGFGQANIKVKWGADAPPSAPRGHDKYDRWSMHVGGGPIPAGQPMSPSAAGPSTMDVESPRSEGAAPAAAAGGLLCCCCCARAKSNDFNSNRAALAKDNNASDEGNWQENTAVAAAASSTSQAPSEAAPAVARTPTSTGSGPALARTPTSGPPLPARTPTAEGSAV